MLNIESGLTIFALVYTLVEVLGILAALHAVMTTKTSQGAIEDQNCLVRALILRYTSRREHWNSFSRKLFSGFGGMVRDKSQEGQNELFWFLTVVQNAVVLWNALALEKGIDRARADGVIITDEELNHILPTKKGQSLEFTFQR